MAGVGWGEQQPGQRSRVEKLLVLDPSLTDGSCCWHLLSPEEMHNAIVQAAGESREKRGEEAGGVSPRGNTVVREWECVGPKNYLSNKPTHKNKREQESCQLIKNGS